MKEIDAAHSAELVKSAHERGILSVGSATLFERPALTAAVHGVLEPSSVLKVRRDMVFVTMCPDDSMSMFTENGVVLPATHQTRSVVAGHNELLEAMKRGPEASHSMFQTRFLNGLLFNPFGPPFSRRPMSDATYEMSSLGTPLFEQTLITLGAVLLKCEEAARLGGSVRSATLIMSDGEATDETNESRANLVSFISDMRASGDHVVAGMGIGEDRDGYRKTFTRMGIDPQMIFPAGSSDEILAAFRLFGQAMRELTTGSSSIVRAPTP